MIKKIILVISLCTVLVFAGCKNNSNIDREIANVSENYEEDTKSENTTETFENVQQFFDTVTDDMLNAFETYPSFDSYWNDSLILLNQFNKDVRLYGINVNEQTAMLLYIEGEKILIEDDPFPKLIRRL